MSVCVAEIIRDGGLWALLLSVLFVPVAPIGVACVAAVASVTVAFAEHSRRSNMAEGEGVELCLRSSTSLGGYYSAIQHNHEIKNVCFTCAWSIVNDTCDYIELFSMSVQEKRFRPWLTRMPWLKPRR